MIGLQCHQFGGFIVGGLLGSFAVCLRCFKRRLQRIKLRLRRFGLFERLIQLLLHVQQALVIGGLKRTPVVFQSGHALFELLPLFLQTILLSCQHFDLLLNLRDLGQLRLLRFTGLVCL